MHRKGESLLEVSSIILGIRQSSLQQGESSKEPKKRKQADAEPLEYYSLQAKINNSPRKAHLQQDEKHCDTIRECNKLKRALNYKNRKNIRLTQDISRLIARNKQQTRKHKKLAREINRLNIEFGKVFGSSLSDRANVIKSQMTIDAKDKQIEYFKSIALVHCGKPLQHGDSTEESDTTIQGMEKLRLEVSEVKNQLQETNRTLNKTIQVFENYQQETDTRRLASLNWMSGTRIQEQDNYNYHDAEPIGSGDGSLPEMPGLDFSAPTPFPFPSLPAVSSDTVAFEPLSPRSNEPMASHDPHSIHPPRSLTSSVRSQDAGGAFLSVLPRLEYQNESWTGFSR
ncbi:hypothetical protein NHJ13051_005445 [Beauveria bassiana]